MGKGRYVNGMGYETTACQFPRDHVTDIGPAHVKHAQIKLDFPTVGNDWFYS